MKDLQSVISLHFGVQISVSALATHINEKLNISYKMIKNVYEGCNREDVKTERRQYVEELMQVTEYEYNHHFVFIDESGFQPSSFKKRGYAVRGQRPVVIGRPQTKRINVVGAISGQGKVHVEMQVPQHKKENFNSTKFMAFMKNLDRVLKVYCMEHDVDESRIHLILDNCRIHGSQEVQEYWDDCSYTVRYVPKYSPMLNAIEEVFYIFSFSFGPK